MHGHIYSREHISITTKMTKKLFKMTQKRKHALKKKKKASKAKSNNSKRKTTPKKTCTTTATNWTVPITGPKDQNSSEQNVINTELGLQLSNCICSH